jgi:hypothetical protein
VALAALITAIVGLLVALGTLAWQIISWRNEGPKVKVTTAWALPTYSGRVGDRHLCVTAVNLGRSPILLTAWGYELPDGKTLVPPPLPWATQPPHTLEGGHEASFYIEAAVMANGVAKGTKLRPFVLTPHGRVYAKDITFAG